MGEQAWLQGQGREGLLCFGRARQRSMPLEMAEKLIDRQDNNSCLDTNANLRRRCLKSPFYIDDDIPPSRGLLYVERYWNSCLNATTD